MANWATTALLGDPRDPEWQRKNLQTIEPVAGQRWNVYGPAAAAFSGLIKDLAGEGYPVQSSGGFNYRNIRGSDKLSQHAFGTAIDLNAATNPMGGSTDLPANVGQLAASHGLEWGGAWKNPDPMHFEYKGNPVTTPVPASGHAALFAPPGDNAAASSGGASSSLLASPLSMLPPLLTQPAQSGDGFAPVQLLAEKFKPMQDAMQSFQQGYSSDRFLSDMFAGQNPMRRMVFGALGNLYRSTFGASA
jgi:hypothetical protein